MTRHRRKPTPARPPVSSPAPAAAPPALAEVDAGEAAQALDRRRKLLIGALLIVGSFLLYAASGKTISFALGGDSIPNRLIPFSILKYGTLTMDPFAASFEARGGYRWYVQERRDHLVSYYPIGTPVVAVPFYLPIYGYAALTGRDSAEDLFALSELAEKLVAAAMTSLTVLVVWLALLRRTSWRRATWTAVILACCSLLWPVASQTLWQHTVVAMLLAAVALLASPPDPLRRPLVIGLLMGLCFAVRPQSVSFGAAAGVALLLAGGAERPPVARLKAALLYAAGFLLPAVPSLAYSRHYYGTWAGGYSSATVLFSSVGSWIFEGMSGLLFSPNRGLFVLMPVAVVGVVGAWRVLQRPERDPILAGLLVGGFLYYVLHAATQTWAGGWCFGPRYLTETLPALAVASSLALVRPRRIAIGALSVAVVWSFLMQLSGSVFFPASAWNVRMSPDLERSSWNGSHFMPWEDYMSWRASRAAARASAP